MLFKMRHSGPFRGDAVEHTYLESVHVRGGIAVCRNSQTRDALRVRGYDLIEEISLELKADEKIPDELYTEKASSPEGKSQKKV